MVVRVSLAVVSVVAFAWLGVLLRNERVAQSAGDRIFYASPPLGEEQLDRELERLKGARLLDPDPGVDEKRAGLLLLRGRPRESAAIAASLARREPANLVAWTLLYRATRGRDPQRAARARAEIRRLNPLDTTAAGAVSRER